MGSAKKYPLGSAKHANKPRALAELLKPTAKKALGGRTLALRELILSWPAAVGPEFAAGTRPEGLSRARAGEACLTLAVDPSRALIVQHESARFIERVNGFFGYELISRLRLVQRIVRTADPEPPKPERAPLEPQTSAEIASRLGGIADDKARAVLQEMGELVRTRQRRPRTGTS